MKNSLLFLVTLALGLSVLAAGVFPFTFDCVTGRSAVGSESFAKSATPAFGPPTLFLSGSGLVGLGYLGRRAARRRMVRAEEAS